MSISDSYQEAPEVWAQQHFGDNDLGDVRRNRRVVRLAAALAAQPGASIPKLFQRPYDVKATYHLLSQSHAPEQLQTTHRQKVRQHLHQPGRFLLIEDASVLSWTGLEPIPGLGPVGKGKQGMQGFTLQSVLALQWPDTPSPDKRPALQLLGLPCQLYHVRHPDKAQRGTPEHPTEAQLWLHSNQALGPAPKGTHWIRVCDRAADIYEFLASCQELHHGFVVRASKNRVVTDPETDKPVGHLFSWAQSEPACGHFRLDLRSRAGKPARTAELHVSVRPVVLRAPQRKGAKAGSLPPIACQVLRVWEAEPPPGEAGLEWILLCDQPLENVEAVLETVRMYASRWLIEEFHKALKTGVAAQKLQLETAERLFSAVAIWSVVALRLLGMREHVRLEPAAPAEEAGLSELELKVLSVHLKRKLKTVKDVALAIGRLGGHMNRKGDGLPGWQTLLYGMEELLTLTQGVRLAMQFSDTFRE